MRFRVAIIGAGGLGGPIAYALAAAGAHLTLCDHDTVELSNLQRQIQFTTQDIGRSKVEALADELVRRGHDPGTITRVAERFVPENAAAVLAGADVVIDGSDDFATKFAVNDQAMARGLPFVIASVLRYSGQIVAVAPLARASGCYRCLFEEVPAEDDAATCAGAGVLGAAVAVVGGLAARAALALVRGRIVFSGPPGSALWVMDDVRASGPSWIRPIAYQPRPGCPACASVPRAAAGPGTDNHAQPVRLT